MVDGSEVENPRVQTYLPLLLLPGRVEQQVSVPALLLGHVRLILMDGVGVAVSYLGFDGCHHGHLLSGLVGSPKPSAYREKIFSATTDGDARAKDLLETRGLALEVGVSGKGGCRDQTPPVQGACAEVVLPLTRDPVGRGSFPGQK